MQDSKHKKWISKKTITMMMLIKTAKLSKINQRKRSWNKLNLQPWSIASKFLPARQNHQFWRRPETLTSGERTRTPRSTAASKRPRMWWSAQLASSNCSFKTWWWGMLTCLRARIFLRFCRRSRRQTLSATILICSPQMLPARTKSSLHLFQRAQ